MIDWYLEKCLFNDEVFRLWIVVNGDVKFLSSIGHGLTWIGLMEKGELIKRMNG